MVDNMPLQSNIVEISQSVNAVFILVASFLVFFMQPGFALLEVGQVRAKNTANVAMKNLIDWSQGVLTYFLVGAGVAYLVGGLTSPGAVSVASAFTYIGNPDMWIGWLFGAVFAMTAATIVSGAVAGRIEFSAYVVLGFCIVAVVYPVVQGFVWQGGLLSAEGYIGRLLGTGYIDFAGATVVHMVGGIAGLIAAKRIGPRSGRFDDEGVNAIPGHSVFLTMLGTFILAFGWYGFNVGTQSIVLTETGSFNGRALGRVAVVTTLGMGAGTLVAALVTTFERGKPDPVFSANGMLAGLVAITGAAGHVTWWGGIALGALGGGMVVPVHRWVTRRLRVDDVCGVFAVHGFSGAAGTLLIPLFAVNSAGQWAVLGANQFLMQAVGIAIIALWTTVGTVVALRVIDQLLGIDLRVDEGEETRGLDAAEHGVLAYPEFALTDGGSAESESDEPGTRRLTEPDSSDDSIQTSSWRGQEVQISTKTDYERELEELTTRLELTLEETETGIWEWDIATGRAYWDETCERLFGYEPGGFPGTYEAFTDRVAEEHRDYIAQAERKALENGEEYKVTFKTAPPDGEARWLQARGVVQYADDGDPERMVGVQTDVTDQKERETQLRETKRTLEKSNEKLERFAGVVSHDLRNPLMVVMARLDMIREGVPNEHFAAMDRNLGRMEQMIDDLLTLARIGETIDQTVSVTLADAAEESWNHVQLAECELQVDVPPEVQIEADRERLLQIFENLFVNALAHNSPPLLVRVGVLDASDGSDSAVGFYVEDDGEGIPESDLEDVLTHGYTTSDDGSGFGLSIVREIVEAHDWQIEVCNGGHGGARFEITRVQTPT